ncbi:MAG: acetylesterase [Lachnospiraceae bacterium]|nr:acetylesterase [Lachnospiraceae bacterium]
MALAEVSFFSQALRHNVKIQAYIPTDRNMFLQQESSYSCDKAKTLYLLHGIGGDCNDYITYSNIIWLALNYNLAIIFPSGDVSFYLEDEEKEMDYSRFIGSELVSFTRAMFPLSQRKEDTFIGGLSMGGYGAVINGLRFSDVFSKIISMSGAFLTFDIADTGSYPDDPLFSTRYRHSLFGSPNELRNSKKEPRHCIEMLGSEGKAIPQLYLTCGKDDFLIKENRIFHEYLLSSDIKHTYIENEGMHNWDYWNRQLEPAIKWLLSDV